MPRRLRGPTWEGTPCPFVCAQGFLGGSSTRACPGPHLLSLPFPSAQPVCGEAATAVPSPARRWPRSPSPDACPAGLRPPQAAGCPALPGCVSETREVAALCSPLLCPKGGEVSPQSVSCFQAICRRCHPPNPTQEVVSDIQRCLKGAELRGPSRWGDSAGVAMGLRVLTPLGLLHRARRDASLAGLLTPWPALLSICVCS